MKQHLADAGIPTYDLLSVPLQQQEAFSLITRSAESLDIAEKIGSFRSFLPIHTEPTTTEAGFCN